MGSIYILNPLGAFIWQQLDGEKSLQEIAVIITGEFDVSAKQAESDLNYFVDELKDIGAVKNARGA